MTGSLDPKVAILTGAATGIGKSIALRLAAEQMRVVVNHLNTSELAQSVVDQMGAGGGEAIAVAADVSDAGQFYAPVTATLERFGHWDVLVNNAGVPLVKPFGEITENAFDRSFATNVKP